MIFDRPSEAFFAFGPAMMRPASWPPMRHDVPTLVEQAKAMFASVIEALARVHAEPRIAIRNVARRLATIAHAQHGRCQNAPVASRQTRSLERHKSLRTCDQSANQCRPLVVSAAAGAGLEFDE